MSGQRVRVRRLEAQADRAVTLWETLPPHLWADVTPEDLRRAAEEAPDALRSDVRALSL